MKKKYVSAILLTAAIGSGLIAYRLAAETAPRERAMPNEYGQLQMLDEQLAAKVIQFMELSDLLTKQLDQARENQNRDSQAPLLVATQNNASPVKTQQPVADKPKAPWWSGYRLSMVVVSNGVRSAVINGRYVKAGDTIGPGIRVHQVSDGRAVLKRAGQWAILKMK